ncbi:MAG TPA: GYF domain-containing protein [Opitutaceae bacterium]|nr:GYF domain-containing protein [Opitutaceae bacterium]
MATQEFYIRNPNETDARGPFTRDQLIAMADAGQISLETLYYEASDEKWVAVSSNTELKAALFPEKKRLGLKAKDDVKTLNVAKEGDAPITVEQMLAASEGKTDETSDKMDLSVAMARAASIGLYSVTACLFISCAALALPFADVIAKGDIDKLMTEPFAILGLVDLILGVMMLLGVTTLYPLVRFRAALGLGFLGFFFWSQGQSPQVAAIVAGSAGLYLCTIFLELVPVIVAAALGVAGMGGFAYLMLA